MTTCEAFAVCKLELSTQLHLRTNTNIVWHSLAERYSCDAMCSHLLNHASFALRLE